MPFFEQNPYSRLALLPQRAAAVLDLSGMEGPAALERLAATIARRQSSGSVSYTVRFDRARGDGRETLFLPVGRLLLEARRAGRIRRCLPLPDGDGYYFELTAGA